MSIDLEGDIDATSLPSLLNSACSTKETGLLTLRRGPREKSIYLKDGAIIFATSDDRDDRLGQVLLRRDIIGLEALEEATAVSLREGKRLGAVLVESDAIRPEELVQGVIAQVKEIVLSVFRWSEGRYQLRLGDLPTEEVITLQMNTGDIMMEGIRQIRSWYRIQEAIGGLDGGFQQAAQVADSAFRMRLHEEELSLLTSLERPASLRDICRWSSLPDFEVGRLLWAFLATGLVVRAAGGSAQVT